MSSMRSRCAFGRRRYGNKSCFTVDELTCMINAWNALQPDDPIIYSGGSSSSRKGTATADDLWNALTHKVEHDSEREWLENQVFMQQVEQSCPELAKTMQYLCLRPFWGKERDDMWLTQKDIHHCLIQLLYSFRHSVSTDLNFLGARPVDHFNSAPQDITIPFDQDWGIILNTVTQREGGEHWVAIFHAERSTTLEYFDSSGQPPPPRLVKVLNMLKARNRYMRQVVISTRMHQEDEYNCGVYTILFLFLRFLSISFEKIEDENLGFVHISHFRKLLFDEHA